MKKAIEDKKGVSPVIATVLLVAIVIVMALLIFLWYSTYMKELIEKRGIRLESSCVRDVEFDITNPKCEDVLGSSNIYFHVENKGDVDIVGFKVSYLNGESGTLNSESVVLRGAGSTIVLDSGKDLVGNSLSVSVIPIISSGTEIKICDSKTITLNVDC